jgi:hypothetical protein
VYFRKPIADTSVYSFSTAGGAIPGGTTTSPTLVVTGADLTTAAGNQIANWQSAIYRPVSNSLLNLQRKTGGGGNSPFMVDYDLDTGTATRIEAYTWYRGQENGSLDPETGAIWIASQNWHDPFDMTGGGKGGGVRKYDVDGTLTPWDTDFNLSIKTFDVAVPPPGPGACCLPAGGGCEILPEEACTGVWKGIGTICDIDICCPDPFADADVDGDVDLDDFAALQTCINPDTVPAGCECFNRDGDTDVDRLDFEAFQACATGSMIPFDPLNPPPGCIP